jgi:succinoglycan biosynthesis transport protein ExoP
LDLRRLIALVRAWLPLMILAAALAGAAAYAVSSLQQKVYEAKATLIVGQSLSAANPDYTQLLVAENLTATYAAVAKTRPILEDVITRLSLDVNPDDLAGRVQVAAPQNSTLITITAQDSVPARAAAIANALADQLIAASPAIQGREAEFQKSIDDDLAATQDLIDTTQARADALIAIENRTATQEADLQTLEGRLASLRSTYATLLSFSSGAATNLLTIIEPAEAPTSSVLPRTLINTLLAAALGLAAVLGIAFLTEQLDDSIKDSDAVQEHAGLSTLGAIAPMKGGRGRGEIYRLATLLYPRSHVAEAYRTLRANVDFASVDVKVRSLLVTSAVSGEGKTVTAANLAVVFAQAGRTVLLVDGDLRKPGINQIFDLPNARGLTTMLRDGSVSLESVAHRSEQAGLRVLTTGPLPPNPAELLASQRMQAVMRQMLQEADLVVFDSPPLQDVTDAAVLSSFVDGTLLVIDRGRSRRRLVRAARETLARAGAHPLGAVLNRVPAQAEFNYAGYGANYGESDGQPIPAADAPGAAASSSGSATGAIGHR